MSQFVVVSGISSSNSTGTNLNERTAPNRHVNNLTGTSFAPGTVLTSLETRNLIDGQPLTEATWERIGTNRWVNRTLGTTHNMLRVTAGGTKGVTTRSTTIRTGPGTNFASVRTLATGSGVVPVSTITTSGTPNLGGAGRWLRIASRQWVRGADVNQQTKA